MQQASAATGTSSSVPMDTATCMDNNNSIFVDSSLPTTADDGRVKLFWRNLCCTMPIRRPSLLLSTSSSSSSRNKDMKQILQSTSGILSTGRLTALLGPSGAGKTTLLNCLAGKVRDGVTGDVLVSVADGNHEQTKLRLAFLPQQTHVFTEFTVFESVLFASRINNHFAHQHEHKVKVAETLASLQISDISDSRLDSISGGQLKRTAIALEVVRSPDILMLDEPTTGLDSDNSETVVRLLHSLASQCNMMIVTTIHQPSHDAFHMFDDVCFLSRHGTTVYFGPPSGLRQWLKESGLAMRQTTTAEYMMEIANGRHGRDVMILMASKTTAVVHRRLDALVGSQVPLDDVKMLGKSAGNNSHFALLLQRCCQQQSSKSIILLVRIAISLLHAVVLCHLVAEPIGRTTGCLKGVFAVDGEGHDWRDSEGDSIKSLLLSTADAVNGRSFDMAYQVTRVHTVSMFIYMLSLFTMSTNAFVNLSLGTRLVLATDREVGNDWYRVPSLFAAHMLAEAIFSVFIVLPGLTYMFFAGELPVWPWQRFVLMFAATYIVTLTWSSRGLLLAILCAPYESIAHALSFAMLLLSCGISGFLVRVESMHDFLQALTLLSEVYHSFIVQGAAIFAYGRCTGGHVTERIVKHVMMQKSLVRISEGIWSTFNISKADLHPGAVAVGLPIDYLDQLHDAMDDEMGSFDDDWMRGRDDDEDDFDSSFMLPLLNIKQSYVGRGIFSLLIFLILGQIVVFQAMAWRFRSK